MLQWRVFSISPPWNQTPFHYPVQITSMQSISAGLRDACHSTWILCQWLSVLRLSTWWVKNRKVKSLMQSTVPMNLESLLSKSWILSEITLENRHRMLKSRSAKKDPCLQRQVPLRSHRQRLRCYSKSVTLRANSICWSSNSPHRMPFLPCLRVRASRQWQGMCLSSNNLEAPMPTTRWNLKAGLQWMRNRLSRESSSMKTSEFLTVKATKHRSSRSFHLMCTWKINAQRT